MSATSYDNISWHTHKNYDGSPGGQVADSASVGENVLVRKTARVLPGAEVPDNTVIELGVFYTEQGPLSFSKP